MLTKLKSIYNEYPKAFWVYNIVVFIDRFGGFMLYPFFALYLTKKFDIGMFTVGLLISVFLIFRLVGSPTVGALTHRVGRQRVIIFNPLVSSLRALCIR